MSAVDASVGTPYAAHVRPWFVVVIVATLMPAHVATEGGKWWQSRPIQHDLQLTSSQVAAIEHVFQATLPERRRLRSNLDRLEAELRRRMAAPDDDDAMLDLIDRVEAARAKRNVARTVLLVRMRRILTPDQRLQLDALARRASAAGHELTPP